MPIPAKPIRSPLLRPLVALTLLCVSGIVAPVSIALSEDPIVSLRVSASTLRAAIEHLDTSFGPRYPDGDAFLRRLKSIETQLDLTSDAQDMDWASLTSTFVQLRREALLANPLLREQPILFVARAQYKPDHHATATIFQTNEINAASFAGRSAIKLVDVASRGQVTTLLEVPHGIARDPEISYDARRIVFSMRVRPNDDYHIYELVLDTATATSDESGSNELRPISVTSAQPDQSVVPEHGEVLAGRRVLSVRQLTFGSGVAEIDPVYLPDGRIVLSSTRDTKYCQCNRHIMANLFIMDADGGRLRMIGGSGLFEGHPHVMPDGTILYDRWEYVDRQFGPSFGLWTLRPDGTNHALFYGNNAWAPGMIADARMVPGTQLFIATYGSCHDRPWGAIALVDRARGFDGSSPVLRIWPPSARQWLDSQSDIEWHPEGIDLFKGVEKKYEDPYPLSDTYFLCSRMVEGERTGLVLLDRFGNEIVVHAEATGCFDPMPLAQRARPGVLPARSNMVGEQGMFYVADVYRGTGMERVPHGSIRYLRIIEAPYKRAWTHTLWNVDATQAPAMNWNLTNNKRIIGDVPVETDGSAYFSVPANTFIYFQALDERKMMVQSMRSGTIAQAGEVTGCVGCHEPRRETIPNEPKLAWRRPSSAPEPWYGAAREFNYLTEVQPVFDQYCVSCHDYGQEGGEALVLAGDLGLTFNASYLELHRKSAVRWSADESEQDKLLVKAVHDGPPAVLPAYAWGSHRSRLIEVLMTNHYDVKLPQEAFERIVTWIDLNAVYYGSYTSVYRDHPYGRSPLSGAELTRLAELAGLNTNNVDRLFQDRQIDRGLQVNFTRPALSPLLSLLDGPDDPRYREALAIIEIGAQRLITQPREDMLGVRAGPLVEDDVRRQERFERFLRDETEARRAPLDRGEAANPGE